MSIEKLIELAKRLPERMPDGTDSMFGLRDGTGAHFHGLVHAIKDALPDLEAMRDQLQAAAWVLGAARLRDMGGTPDLFGPDVDGYGLIAEAGEDCWDTWDRYATEAIEAIEDLFKVPEKR